jgi:subtilisin family serine protease
VWAVAAGNWAQQHWAGPFRDRDGDGVHEFANGLEENARSYRAGDLITVSLRWDEPFGAACTDFDLELFGVDGALVRASRRPQQCQGDPVEGVQVLATRDGQYRVRVIEAAAPNASAVPRRLELLMLGSPDRGAALDVVAPSGSLAEPADHRDVITVGAVNGGATGAAASVARFSSRGPTTDGRAKPDVVAPTGRSIAGEEVTFSGTSAAAPHVAGMLALLWEALPGATALRVTEELRARAVDLAPPGVDAESGAGLAQLGPIDGLGPLLPAGAASATLVGVVPEGAGIGLLRYSGPAGYPLRFVHLLSPGRRVVAIYRLSLLQARFDRYIVGAPAFVQTFETVRDGDVLFVSVAAP